MVRGVLCDPLGHPRMLLVDVKGLAQRTVRINTSRTVILQLYYRSTSVVLQEHYSCMVCGAVVWCRGVRARAVQRL